MIDVDLVGHWLIPDSWAELDDKAWRPHLYEFQHRPWPLGEGKWHNVTAKDVQRRHKHTRDYAMEHKEYRFRTIDLTAEQIEISEREGWTIAIDLIELLTTYNLTGYDIQLYLRSVEGWTDFLAADLMTNSVGHLEEYIALRRIRYREVPSDAA